MIETGVFKVGGCIPNHCTVSVHGLDAGHYAVHHETADDERHAGHAFVVSVGASIDETIQNFEAAIREHFPVEHYTVYQRGLSD